MSSDPGRRVVIPDFVKGALFTALLLAVALAFASHKAPQQQEQNGGHHGQVVGPSGEAGPTKQEANADQSQSAVAEKSPLDALGDWLLDVKLSDFLLVAFTAVLAWKTAGLDDSTRLLWKAGEDQRALSERIAADRTADTKEALRISTEASKAAADSAQAARHAANTTHAIERPYIFIAEIHLREASARSPNPTIEYSFINAGRSPAIAKMLYARAAVVKDLPLQRHLRVYEFIRANNVVPVNHHLKCPGQIPPLFVDGTITSEMWDQIEAGALRIFFSSVFLYEGGLGKTYLRSVGALYDPMRKEFNLTGDDYNFDEADDGPVWRGSKLPVKITMA